jgi:hypothetical protein
LIVVNNGYAQTWNFESCHEFFEVHLERRLVWAQSDVHGRGFNSADAFSLAFGFRLRGGPGRETTERNAQEQYDYAVPSA